MQMAVLPGIEMTEPIHATVLRISHSSEDELDRKLTVIMQRRGFHVEKAAAERITVGELARRVGRNLTNVSTMLRQSDCPSFVHNKGKRRILWLEPNERLMTHLTPTPKGPLEAARKG